MPKKMFFEKDLIRVNIRRKDYDEIIKYKSGNEPFYSTVRRLWDIRNTPTQQIEYAQAHYEELARHWKTKYDELKKRMMPLEAYLKEEASIG